MTDQQAQMSPGQATVLMKQEHGTAAVISMSSDDFLPSLGQWSQTLGQKVLIGASASLVAMAVWPWRETVRAAGVIRPAGENTIVQSQLDGTLASVWVKQNQQVRKGEPLAALDRERLSNERRKLEQELRESLAQQQSSASQSTDLKQQAQATESLSRAQIRSAARDVDSASATLRFRETELARYRSLLASGAVQASIVDEKAAQVELSRNDLAKARQALKEQDARGIAELARLRQGSSQTANQSREVNKMLEETRSRLAEVNRALSNSVIKAPTAGTVIASGMRHARQVIRAGEVLAQIAPNEAAQHVKARVPSRDIGNIKPNQDAYLRVSGCPYPEFGVLKARVNSVSADTIPAESPNGLPTAAGFEVVLTPMSRSLQAGARQCNLRHGMDVEAEIVTRHTTVLGSLLTKLRLLSGT
jgi:multidrug efflux pump subunit AcrA (membrane-fusion protein)